MNKKIAITGSTGGIFKELCKKLISDNYDLILVDRNKEKSEENRRELLELKSSANIELLTADMADFNSVKKVTEELKKCDFDYLIIGAAIYNVPLKKLELGYNNVFQVNFISPYYMVKELLSVKDIKVIVTSSIAYNYEKTKEDDIDFSNNKKASHIYGNSKRFLMFSLMKEYESLDKVRFAHPGITLTKMTNHYPRSINWLVKIGIGLIFPKPKKACLNIYEAIKNATPYMSWIGPKYLNLYGKPTVKKNLKISEEEINSINKMANEIYEKVR